MVLLHGYFHGCATWFQSVAELSKHYRVLSIDAPGMGLSDRPAFPLSPEASSAFFVDGIEKWRKAMKIEKAIWVGHSMGGYYLARYAMARPEHVEALLLVSPAGGPEEPESAPEVPLAFQCVRFLWGCRVTPAKFVRALGPLGMSPIRWFFGLRNWFAKEPATAAELNELLTRYLYHHNASYPVCGEDAITTILRPGAWAVEPILPLVKAGKLQVPTGWLYGQWDWMDKRAGREAAESLTALGYPSEMWTIPGSGHQA